MKIQDLFESLTFRDGSRQQATACRRDFIICTWADFGRPILNFDSTYAKLKLRKIFVGVKNGNIQPTAAAQW